MSLLENFLAYVLLEDIQWSLLVSLFVASLVTVLLYLLQYFYVHQRVRHSDADFRLSDEADALLTWVLSLKSWRCQWKTAWLKALNDEAKKPGSPVVLTFEEDDDQSSKLVVNNISKFKKLSECKSLDCQLAAEKLQFSVSVPSNAAPDPSKYTVTISPVQLQLAVQMRETAGEVHISWVLSNLDTWDLRLTPIRVQNGAAGPSVTEVRDGVRAVLCGAQPSVLLTSEPIQGAELKEAQNKVSQASSPPKPPRAHDWKLLVKNIKVTVQQEVSAADGSGLCCLLRLDDPPQRFTSSVSRNSSSLSWDQPFIFELSGRSKELTIHLLEDGNSQEGSLLGEVSVPFDLVKKQPNGLQTFPLAAGNQVVGSLSTEFTYLEPSEVRTWQAPTPAPTRKVEMDRTVMPCGTVVTTVTAVRSKPGRTPPSGLSAESPLNQPSKLKLSESGLCSQELESTTGATVSKALSSSDTELMMLNGTDPVAEAAIRQLHKSAKQKLKSPVKKSTIIISGVAKAPLSQDDEMALMAGYAAAMDASMTTCPDSAPAPSVAGANLEELSDPEEGPSGTPPVASWDSQSAHEADMDKKSALSLCMSEPASKKGKGSFLHKSAKLFFRRRHQRKDPGMSQSHNDLVYLEQPTVEKDRRTATFSRIINRKLLSKNKSAANGLAGDQHA